VRVLLHDAEQPLAKMNFQCPNFSAKPSGGAALGGVSIGQLPSRDVRASVLAELTWVHGLIAAGWDR
jgi:hypothetical protein